MKNPAAILPGAMQAIQALYAAVQKGDVDPETLRLMHLRASQINGCSSCVDAGIRDMKQAGDAEERMFTVSTWRYAPYFTEAERAALALTEAVTRISDAEDPVPDAVWNEAARYYAPRELASLVLAIATTNVFNRLNVSTRQVAGAFME